MVPTEAAIRRVSRTTVLPIIMAIAVRLLHATVIPVEAAAAAVRALRIAAAAAVRVRPVAEAMVEAVAAVVAVEDKDMYNQKLEI